MNRVSLTVLIQTHNVGERNETSIFPGIQDLNASVSLQHTCDLSMDFPASSHACTRIIQVCSDDLVMAIPIFAVECLSRAGK